MLLYKADGTYFLTSTSIIGKEISITITDDVTNGYLQINRTENEYDVEAEYTLKSDDGYNVYSDLSHKIYDVSKNLNGYVEKDGIEQVTLDNLQDFTSLNKCNLGVGCIDGKVLQTENPVDNVSYFYTNPMYGFEVGNTYAVKVFNAPVIGWQVFITFWKADNTYNGNKYCGTLEGMAYNFTIPIDTAYIKVSTKLVFKGHIMIEEGTSSSGIYEDYGAVIHSKKPLEAENLPHVFHVKKDGTGDFTKLVDAITYAEKWMDSVVYVGDGTWDLIDELGESFINSVSASKRGIYLKNRIKLVFSSRSYVSCDYTGDRDLTKQWLSPFNAGVHGFTVENLKMYSHNVRYSIHDERDSDEDFYVNKYINCYFYNHNEAGGFRQCIGGGLGKNGYIVIENCIFENPTVNNNSLVSYHNTANVGGGSAKSNIEVSNCYVKGTGTLRFSWYGTSTDTTIVKATGNNLGSPIQFVAETSDGASPNENIELYEWNNIIRS